MNLVPHLWHDFSFLSFLFFKSGDFYSNMHKCNIDFFLCLGNTFKLKLEFESV